jgi:hypothetical protein
VNTNVLDDYVGHYQLAPTAVLTVTRQGDQLFAQLTGQPKAEIFPKSDTEFFYKVVDAQISFKREGDGPAASLVLHQNGRDMVAPRIDDASAEQAAAKLAAKIQSQTATPGSEAALQRLIESIAAGKPNYSEMSPELANVTREQLPKLKAAADHFGSVKSIKFHGVGNQGWDIYDVQYERGSVQWRIALAGDGRIAGALMSAGP